MSQGVWNSRTQEWKGLQQAEKGQVVSRQRSSSMAEEMSTPFAVTDGAAAWLGSLSTCTNRNGNTCYCNPVRQQ